MIELDTLKDDVPEVILESVKSLGTDIDIETYSKKGANGYVFFGHNKVSKINLAIKYYYYGKDFHDEVRLLARIDNENIIKILDAHTVGEGWAYFLTQQTSHGDLDDALAKGIISYRDGINVVRGILNGLVDLHGGVGGERLLHRDLKPANILLDDKLKPIIADFGSVKMLPAGNSHINASKHAPLYRPPEGFANNIYLISSDIYQVGLVMFQILGGYLPYSDLEWMSEKQRAIYCRIDDAYERSKYLEQVLYSRAKSRKLMNLNSLPKYVSDNVKNIIRVATRPDYTKRYQSCSRYLLAVHDLGVLPDWHNKRETIELWNFKGLDYRIIPIRNMYKVEKKKTISNNWRTDNTFGTAEKDEMIIRLKNFLHI